jgi:ABC-type transport system involved in multi-copper enzyme maturation permease subunit
MLAVRVALFEIRYLLRLPRTYFLFVLFFCLGFLFSPMLDPQMFGARGAANINSPFFVTAIHLACGFFAVLFLPPYLSASLRRDVDCQFDEILFSTPVPEGAYLTGRFFGAYVSLMLVLSGATLGMLFSNVWPLWTPASVGETHVSYYATAYFVFSAPTMLVLAALISSAIVAFGRTIYAYAGVVVLLICSALGSIARGVSGAIGSTIDPFLIAALAEQTQYWTPAELNSTAISYGAPVVQNRLLWIAVAAALALLVWRTFSFRSAAARRASRKTVLDRDAATSVAFSEPLDRSAAPRWTVGTGAHQFHRLLAFELKAIFYGRPFLVFLALSVISLYLLLPNVRAIYGAAVFPLTRLMIEAIFGVLSLPLAIVLIYGTGEIVWRERSYRVDEIVDSMPVPSWVLALSKFASLTVVLASIVILPIVVAVGFQLSSGYSDLELGTYIGRGFFFMFLPAVFFGGLALLGQALAAGRFLGLLTIPLYALVAFGLGVLGYNHPLSRLGSTIPAPLSDMSESGQFMSATYWLSLYWTFVTALLVLLACVSWNRGTRTPWRQRLLRLKAFSNPRLAASAAALALLAVASASYVYYNTNVLNRYVTSEGIELRRLSYERQFRQYETLPRPRVTEIDVALDLYPDQSRLSAQTSLTLENPTAEDLSEIHLDFPDVLQVSNVELEGATLRSRDEDFVYDILALDPPMRPGETRSLSFDVSFRQRGFQAGAPNVGLVDNGSYLRYGDLAPHLGYNADYALSDVNVRKKYGLAPLPPARRGLDEPDAPYLSDITQDSDLVRFGATISTALDQIAVSAGTLEREWQEGDRRFFRYALDGLSKVSFPFVSGRYRVVDANVDGIAIQILYHPTHAANIDRMRESVEDSLRYFSNAFGPYQFRQLRIVELPAYYDFVQSNAGTIVYSPGYGFITKPARPGEVDVPYYVTAHEVAHQWWGHQVVTNNSQGDLLLSETLAQYGALLVMEKKYGRDLVRKFLKAELDLYLRGRGSDERGELPLIRVEDQSYIYYRKGAVVMYALRDYLGEDTVNSALRRLIDSYAYRTTSHPTSRNFIEILKAEAGTEYETLIADLFERITLYDFRVRTANTEQLPDGRFRTTIDVSAAKYYADAAGQQVEARLDIPVDVGLFFRSPADGRFTGDDVIWLDKQEVLGGDSTLQVIVDRMPAFAGIDPYNKLIDRNSDDNLLRVGVLGTAGRGR